CRDPVLLVAGHRVPRDVDRPALIEHDPVPGLASPGARLEGDPVHAVPVDRSVRVLEVDPELVDRPEATAARAEEPGGAHPYVVARDGRVRREPDIDADLVVDDRVRIDRRPGRGSPTASASIPIPIPACPPLNGSSRIPVPVFPIAAMPSPPCIMIPVNERPEQNPPRPNPSITKPSIEAPSAFSSTIASHVRPLDGIVNVLRSANGGARIVGREPGTVGRSRIPASTTTCSS